MSLRARLLIIIVTAIGLALIGILGIAQWSIMPRLLAVEEKDAKRNAVRVVEILQRDLQSLVPACEDWGYWDDTYEFVRAPNSDYVDSNLQLQSLQALGVNFVAIMDGDGRVLHQVVRNKADTVGFSIRELQAPIYPASHAFQRFAVGSSVTSGATKTSSGAMLFCSARVTDSDKVQPYAGFIVFGRLIDPAALERVARQSEMRIDIRPTLASDAHSDRSTDEVVDGSLRHTPFHLDVESEHIIAHSNLLDVFGAPLLHLSVHQPRYISEEGRRGANAFIVIAILIALVTAAVAYWLVDRGIFAGVRRLARNMRKLSQQPLQLEPIPDDEPGELGHLAREFNALLGQLERTRKMLAEQNFRRGASEIASSLIANLRQQVQRLDEQCEAAQSQLDQVQVGNQQLLIKQLSERNDSPPQLQDGLNLLRSQVADSATLLSESRSELRALRRSLNELSLQIADFNKYYSDSAQSVALDLMPLLDHALEALELHGRHDYGIEVIHPAQHLPQAYAPREVLQQVLVSLLHFLHDVALRHPSDDPQGLRIGVHANTASLPMLNLSFDDRNCSPENSEFSAFLEQYERRRNAAGLDLSWMHAAVTAMGGALHIEALPGRSGLRATLSLPVARRSV